jgi:hypothetical protein
MQLENPEMQVVLQRALGQILLYPPTVAGWPGGTNWIDSSSLLLRMRLPQLIALAEPFEVATKADDDVQMGRMNEAFGKKGVNRFLLKGDIEWEAIVNATLSLHQKDAVPQLCKQLLQCHQNMTATIAAHLPPGLPLPQQIQQATLLAMATPAYQLC